MAINQKIRKQFSLNPRQGSDAHIIAALTILIARSGGEIEESSLLKALLTRGINADPTLVDALLNGVMIQAASRATTTGKAWRPGVILAVSAKPLPVVAVSISTELDAPAIKVGTLEVPQPVSTPAVTTEPFSPPSPDEQAKTLSEAEQKLAAVADFSALE